MKIEIKDLHALDCYVWDDTPVNCPRCGRRTDFIELAEDKQQHKCPCGYEFFVDLEEEQKPMTPLIRSQAQFNRQAIANDYGTGQRKKYIVYFSEIKGLFPYQFKFFPNSNRKADALKEAYKRYLQWCEDGECNRGWDNLFSSKEGFRISISYSYPTPRR